MDSSAKQGCENKEQMAPYPKTTKELVTNLKLALESGEMEKQEFYTEGNLKKLSGAVMVEFHPQDGGDIYVDLSDLKSNLKFSSIPQDRIYHNGITIVKAPYTERQSVISIIRINLNPIGDQTLSYPDVTDLFACGWNREVTAIVHREWPLGRYRKAVNQYGNEHLSFFKEQMGRKITSTLLFDEAGYIEQVYFEVKR